MPGFYVDMARLIRLQADLAGLDDQLERAASELGSYTTEMLGTAQLDEAGDTFAKDWAHALGRMGWLVNRAAGRLKQTITTYDENEDEVRKAMGG
jgi:hypothetical protein